MIFHVSLEKAEDGWIVAQCPALPGCVSQGQDEQEALENIAEAIHEYLAALNELVQDTEVREVEVEV